MSELTNSRSGGLISEGEHSSPVDGLSSSVSVMPSFELPEERVSNDLLDRLSGQIQDYLGIRSTLGLSGLVGMSSTASRLSAVSVGALLSVQDEQVDHHGATVPVW